MPKCKQMKIKSEIEESKKLFEQDKKFKPKDHKTIELFDLIHSAFLCEIP